MIGPFQIQRLLDGTWSELPSFPQLAGVLSSNVIRRFKIMANVNPFSGKGTQEGSFTISADENKESEYHIHASFRGDQGGAAILSIQSAGH